ncbi:MAG TPA: aldehyde dehydrogenase [Candidatus Binataceae bacterium]|nr:aldehyde dehydrogenase [Candidatus Binataceae bacterium]
MDANLLIDNKDIAATGGATFERRDPLTGEVATRAAAATVEDAVAAVDSAAKAFPAWAAVGPTERRGLLLKAADLLEAHAPDFAKLMKEEMGGNAVFIHFNVGLAAGIMREAASLTTQVTGETIPTDKPGCLSITIRQPVGVILSIAPWNGPVILAVRAIAYPLACGNTVVLKASELSPGTHHLIGEVMREAGLPQGVVNIISNAPADAAKIVGALIAHPAVRRVNFTGSTKTGRIIAETAARYLKPVLLELGGKSPLLVLDDGDLDQAVNAAAFGAFFYQGQVCMSTERVVVDQSVADEFVAKFGVKAASIPVGNSRNADVAIGTLIDRSAADRIDTLIKEAIKDGAKLVAGGKREGTIMSPTVLDFVTPKMRIYHEETFGPVTCVVRARDVEDAIRIANDTDYGLSASVFGRDVNRAFGVAMRIDSGMCHINGPTINDEAQIPFGGTKSSGYGRFGGKAVINEFTELRWITIESGAQHYPF